MRMGGDWGYSVVSENDLMGKDADVLDSPYYEIYGKIDKGELKEKLRQTKQTTEKQ